MNLGVSIFSEAVHTDYMGSHTASGTTNVWKKKRDELKTKRDSLFYQFARRPHDVHLSLEIKKIDDEVSECREKIDREARSSIAKRGSS